MILRSLQRYLQQTWALPVGFLLLLGLPFGCTKDNLTLTTTSDVNITGYLEEDPSKFSEFIGILKKTGMRGVLNAYGTYTLFAPDNNAVKSWLAETGRGSVDEISSDDLKELVRYHLIVDTLSTGSFTDGKMQTVTLYGQYLVTGATLTDGVSRISINRRANITQGNIVTGNGIIHVIDKVLIPPVLTLAALVESKSEYSIFTQALRETGYYDSLNVAANPDTSRQWLTVLAQKDEVFRAAGFADYEALKARYSTRNNPKDPADSLHLFVAYHILPGIRYLADIISAASHETLAPQEVITSKLSGQQILINEDTFNGVLEPGIALNREESDFQAVNGALHTAEGHLGIKVRTPYPIYWDPADQPEIRKQLSVFRRPAQTVDFTDPSQFADMKWEGGTITYTTVTGSDSYVYGDFLKMFMRTAVTKWIEFTTPFIVRGRYKIWTGYRRQRLQTIQVLFDDEPLPNLLLAHAYYPTAETPEAAEAMGYKRYVNNALTVANNPCVLLGTVDVRTSGRHKIRFVSITNETGGANTFNLDQIHIIPSDMEQKWPKFNVDGSPVYE